MPPTAIPPQTGTIPSADGTRLFLRRWPVASPRGTVAIVHGYADHSARYEHVARFLNEGGFGVAAIDLRGHGNSEGRRGHVDRYADYLDDVDAFLEAVRSDPPPGPIFLLGHSNGGLVSLHHAIERPSGAGIAGLVVSCPFLGVAMKVPAIKASLGRVMSVLWPSLALPSGINPADLSHDPQVGRDYAADPLVFKTATARWFTEAMATIGRVQAGAGGITIPFLLQQAGQDRLADPLASGPLFDSVRSTDKTRLDYPDLFHEIYNESDNARPLGDLREWLLERA